jgi:hypothetical protein
MKTSNGRLRTAGLVALGCVIVGASYFGTSAILYARQQARYQLSARIDSGPEVAMVFIGASRCAACRSRDLPALVERLKLIVQQRARARGCSFATIGVAEDADPDPGVGLLRRFGHFDEIVSGRGWLNMGCRRYIQDFPGAAATPQVLVVSRYVVHGGEGITIRNERPLVRKVGLDDIRSWVDGGGPLPAFETPTLTRE